MKKTITILLLLIFSSSQAGWNSFVYINAETQEKYGFNVIISPITTRMNTYKFTMNAVGYNYKHAWLIIARNKLSLKEQRLRNFIRKGEAPQTELLTSAMLHPHGNGLKLYYEFELNIEHVRAGYVYIDFPEGGTEDGYFYTVDLNSFLVAYEKEAATASPEAVAEPVNTVSR